jgi:hypothetical protein
MKVRNPFRRAMLRTMFDSIVRDYESGHANLMSKHGQENRLNVIGEAFWRGFHNERYHGHPRAPLYAAYCAGREVAKALDGPVKTN